MMKQHFSTKAGNLLVLNNRIRQAAIPALFSFSTAQWKSEPEAILSKINLLFSEKTVIIRSSSATEDQLEFSEAGRYLSLPNVKASDMKLLTSAIDRVWASYSSPGEHNEVLVQEMVSDIQMAGVLMTCDPDQLSPYYIVNFDETGSFDGVTSGNASTIKTWVQLRESNVPPPFPWISGLFKLAKELEQIFDYHALDIEFAIDKQGHLWLLQVRPIVKKQMSCDKDQPGIHKLLGHLEKELIKVSSPHPCILGKETIYSIMSDWNPAEMIGLAPRALSISLYRELITDRVWAEQRHRYGYRDLRGFPLLHSFLGTPFINVRASFNSFIPADIPDDIARKLIDYYLDYLKCHPELHDKVEFEVLFTCFDFDLRQRLDRLTHTGFSTHELDVLESSLLTLTKKIIQKGSVFYKDLNAIEKLEGLYSNIESSGLSPVNKTYWLIENCRKYGSLPFAGLARAGFIAVQLLRSLETIGILSHGDCEAFMGSLKTVSKDLSVAVRNLQEGLCSKEDFLKVFGHLRPDTYNILSSRYDEAFDCYFPQQNARQVKVFLSAFDLSDAQKHEIQQLLDNSSFELSVNDLFHFIKLAIESRERGKFVFTRSLSRALTVIEDYGQRLGLSKLDLADLDIKEVLDLYPKFEPHHVIDGFKTDIERNRKAFEETKLIRLPHLIMTPADLYGYFLEEAQPTYVTRKRVRAEIVTEPQLFEISLNNKIVCLSRADPGYDWLFTRNIAGLITMYGGSNSHMTIRCAELQLPAAIGTGARLFARLSRTSSIELDCEARNIRLVGEL